MLEAGAVEVRIGASVDGLRTGINDAIRVLDRFSQDAQASLDAAFDGRKLAPALKAAITQAVNDARRGMESQLSSAGEAIERGLIDEKGFADRAKKAGERATDQLKDQFGKMADAGLIPPDLERRLTDDLSAAAHNAGAAAGAVAGDQFAKRMAERMGASGQQMKTLGNRMTLGLTVPIMGFGALAVRAASEFEKSMNKVAALSGAAGGSLQELREQAKRLGIETQYSASQAADAMGFLAMAGFDAQQILAAMPSTLQLAAAAQMEIATAADITSNILTGYGLKVEELGHANDVLVKAFTRSNTNLQQLGEALKYVGPLASGMGMQFEEVAAAIGMFGNAGIQGSMAGTSLRRALSSLANPTRAVQETLSRLGVNVRDSNGALISLADLLERLEGSGATASDMLLLFGDRGGPAMAALLEQGSGALRDFTTELEESGGTAQRIAESQMRGMSGAILELKSAFEGLQIAMTEKGALAGLTGMTRDLGGFVRELADADQNTVNWAISLAAVAAAAGPVMRTLGSLGMLMGGIALTMGGPVAIGATAAAAAIGGIGAVMLKTKLDAAAAAEGMRNYADSIREMSLEAAIADHARLRSELLAAQREISTLEAKRAQADLYGAPTVDIRRQIEAAQKNYADLIRLAESVASRVGEVNTKVADTAGEVKGSADAAIDSLAELDRGLLGTLSRLSDAVERFHAIRGLGVADFDAAPRSLQQAADTAVRLQRELAQARSDMAALGAHAPAGAQEYLENLADRADAAEVAARRLADTWTLGLERMMQVQPDIARTILPNIPTTAVATANYEKAIAELREKVARGLMDPAEFEEAGREAGERYKAALLEVLDHMRSRGTLTDEIHAEITAKLTPLIDLSPATREFSTAATDVSRGLVNVADAFGGMSDKSRRAVTGLNEVVASLGQMHGGGLFQAANIGSLVGLMGGLAQTFAGLLGGNKEARDRMRSNTDALEALRHALSGFQTTGAALGKINDALNGIIGAGRVGKLSPTGGPLATKMLEKALSEVGMSFQDLMAIADEYGYTLLDSKGRIDWATLASADFAEMLRLATEGLTGFRDTMDDQRRRQAIEDDLFNRPADAAQKLANQMELLEKFMPEFAKSLGEIDTSTAAGRAKLEKQIQEMWAGFLDGSLGLEELTREQFLALVQGFAGAFDDFRDSVDSAIGALSNIPPIFDLIARRRMAGSIGGFSAPAPPAMPASAAPVDYSSSMSVANQIVINHPPAGMDTERVARDVLGALSKLQRQGGASELSLLVRGSV